MPTTDCFADVFCGHRPAPRTLRTGARAGRDRPGATNPPDWMRPTLRRWITTTGDFAPPLDAPRPGSGEPSSSPPGPDPMTNPARVRCAPPFRRWKTSKGSGPCMTARPPAWTGGSRRKELAMARPKKHDEERRSARAETRLTRARQDPGPLSWSRRLRVRPSPHPRLRSALQGRRQSRSGSRYRSEPACPRALGHRQQRQPTRKRLELRPARSVLVGGRRRAHHRPRRSGLGRPRKAGAR